MVIKFPVVKHIAGFPNVSKPYFVFEQPFQEYLGRNPRSFRRVAHKLIKDFKGTTAGTHEYIATSELKPKSLRSRLLDAIYSSASNLDSTKITEGDEKLFNKLKKLWTNYEENDDYMDAFAGGGGHYIDRTITTTLADKAFQADFVVPNLRKFM